MRQDIKRTFYQAIDQASTSIYLSVYGISDQHMIQLCHKKAKEGIDLQVEYDPSASLPLIEHLPYGTATPIKTKGLMHRKVVVIDHETVFLGSANFTPTSLKYHSNLVLGLRHKGLAAYLERPFSNHYSFEVGGVKGSLFLLPDPSRQSFLQLIDTLETATKSIQIAMFTLTHPLIAKTLIEAKKRGVDISVAIDYYTARGASKKLIDQLTQEGIPCYLSQGKELLHYKWALIDEEIFIMGSANWTSAAFEKNQDFVLFLSNLPQKQLLFIKNLWDIIRIESIDPR